MAVVVQMVRCRDYGEFGQLQQEGAPGDDEKRLASCTVASLNAMPKKKGDRPEEAATQGGKRGRGPEDPAGQRAVMPRAPLRGGKMPRTNRREG